MSTLCSLTSRTRPGRPPTAPARKLSQCTHALCRGPRSCRALLRRTSHVPPGSCSADLRLLPLGNSLSYALETMLDYAHNAVLAGTHRLLDTDLDSASVSLNLRIWRLCARPRLVTISAGACSCLNTVWHAFHAVLDVLRSLCAESALRLDLDVTSHLVRLHCRCASLTWALLGGWLALCAAM